MDEQRFDSIDQQGRTLSAAFARAEATERKQRRKWRAPVATFATAAAAAAILFLVIGIGRDDRIFTLDEAVAAVSQAAFDQPGSQPEKFAYVKTRTKLAFTGADKNANLFPFTNEIWYRKGDPTYWDRLTDQLPPTREAQIKTCERKVIKDFEPLGGTERLRLPAGEGFPKDSEALYRFLRDRSEDDPDGLYDRNAKVWDEIGLAMRDGAGTFTPEQRAVLVGVLAEIPGARTLGRVTDRNGNETIAFERDRRGYRDRLYFDARSSITTFSQTTLTRPDDKYLPGLKAGDTFSEYALLEYRYVDAPPDLKEYSPGKVKFGKRSVDYGKC